MAIYYCNDPVQRILKVASGKTADDDLYLIEIAARRVFSVPRKRLTADNGVGEIVRTATATQGNRIKDSQLPLFLKTA